MTVKLDDNSMVEVWISDEFADEATPKKVKVAYLEKMNEIEILRAKAAELGLVLIPDTPGTVVNTTSAQTAAPPPPPLPVVNEGINLSDRVLDASEADKPLNVSVDSGNTGVGHIPELVIKTSDDPTGALKRGEKVQIETVEGRLGTSIAIPAVRSGPSGVTKVQVRNDFDDNQLQRIFKDTAKENRESYVKFSLCPLCRGDTTIRGKKCPKCNGAGELMR